jgi:hypothetical protein
VPNEEEEDYNHLLVTIFFRNARAYLREYLASGSQDSNTEDALYQKLSGQFNFSSYLSNKVINTRPLLGETQISFFSSFFQKTLRGKNNCCTWHKVASGLIVISKF